MYRRFLNIKKSKLGVIDWLIYSAVVTSPIFTVPQALDIYSSKSATDVSLLTWAAYTYASLLWLIYGIKHKEVPLIVLNSVIFILDLVIVAGIIMYS